jgi:F-type H+-transporting ATPase subunit gamma
MANLRAIRKRIKSVGETQKITKAMKMVAAARLRRAQERVEQARPYAATINSLLEDLAGSLPETIHPFLTRRPVKKRALVVFSADRGLCGAFNSNLFRAVEQELKGETPTTLILLGRKAQVYFGKRKTEIYRMADGEFWRQFTHEKAAALAADLGRGFLDGEFDRVDLLFSEFVSILAQRPKKVTLLPVAAAEGTMENPAETPYIYEPDREEIVRKLVPKAMEVRFSLSCLNSLASEHGARMSAMDFATKNAGEMIDELTLNVNRARQGQITRDLSEIVTSAEAMK